MKKKVLILSLLLPLFFLNSCVKLGFKEATVKVKVTEFFIPQSGVTVCMFDEHKGPGTSFFEPIFANKKVVTEDNGIAYFELSSKDLSFVDSQTTVYFGVFAGSDTDAVVLGTGAITIKDGETKTVHIKL